jgi:oxygen tolerance protein BatD
MVTTHRALRWLVFAIALVAAGRTARADEPTAQFRLGDRDSPHVGVPFHLDLLIEGFDESPQPTVPKLELANAQVTFVAAQPSVSRGIQIINGRRSDFSKVTWVLRWQVEPHKEGRLRIPAVTVTQGSKKATAEPGDTQVDTIPTTDTMKLSLGLPDRPIFVGETVPVTLTWLFRSQPSDMNWSIPLLASDAFTVSAPPVGGARRPLTIPAGGKDLQLPYNVDQTDIGGVSYNRLTATLFLAPRKAGKLDVPPSSVVAALATGRADFFGNAPSRLYRAVDIARTIEVKSLPETDKPANFAGAVGEQFSIDVTTSRSVVKLGEPVDLAIRVKSNQRLDTLALGRLDGEGGLPKDRFVVPADTPTGELADDGKTKTFKVTVQVTGPATEVPAIAFSYFDPTKAAYQTIHSEPIALSVAGSAVVRADDVVAARPAGRGTGPAAAHPGNDAVLDGSLVDAELALSTTGHEDDRPLGGGLLWLLIGLLYAVPVALLAARSYQLRTQSQREDAAEVRAARRKVEDLLDRAGSAPARDVAGPLAAALRDLARLLGRTVDDAGLLAKLETESFSQHAAAVPLSIDLRSDAAGLLRRWVSESRRRRPRAAATAAIVLLGLGLAAPSRASAQPTASPAPAAAARGASTAGQTATAATLAPTGPTSAALADGRAAYQEAMQLTGNASARRAAFARAESALGDTVRAMPGRPELLTDWGNAALGAGDVATATLAYRRALAIDGGNARARHNLAWLRSRQSDAFRPAAGGATDTLLFFHAWPRARKLVVGAAAFAVAILLLVPWSGRRRRGFVGLSLLPFAVWLAMLGSVVVEDRRPDDAVVMDDVVLRAADSAGAPAALPQPLPRGVEVTVIERRDAWTRIRLAGGIAGWIAAGAVERVDRR